MFNAFSFYIKYLTYDIRDIWSNVYNFIVKLSNYWTELIVIYRKLHRGNFHRISFNIDGSYLLFIYARSEINF